MIDRSRDSAGNPTAAGGVILTEGSGVITATVSASGTVDAQMHAWTYRGESVMSSVPAVVPTMINGAALTDSTTLANGDRGLVFPYVAVVPGHDPWQILGACAVVAADAANGPFTANFLGRVRTFRSIPIGGVLQPLDDRLHRLLGPVHPVGGVRWRSPTGLPSGS